MYMHIYTYNTRCINHRNSMGVYKGISYMQIIHVNSERCQHLEAYNPDISRTSRGNSGSKDGGTVPYKVIFFPGYTLT